MRGFRHHSPKVNGHYTCRFAWQLLKPFWLDNGNRRLSERSRKKNTFDIVGSSYFSPKLSLTCPKSIWPICWLCCRCTSLYLSLFRFIWALLLMGHVPGIDPCLLTLQTFISINKTCRNTVMLLLLTWKGCSNYRDHYFFYLSIEELILELLIFSMYLFIT